MEQQLQKLTQAILARGKLLKQLEVQCTAIQASVEEMKPKPVTPPAQASSSTPPAQASSLRSLATGELDAPMLTDCSMNCLDDDTNSRTSAFMPDVASGPPSIAALIDVAITNPEPTDATILVCDGPSDLTPTPSGAAVHSIDLGDEHVPNLYSYQLGARKVFDRMRGTDGISYGFSTNGLILTACGPDKSSTAGIAEVDRVTRRRERAHRVLILARLENSCGALEFRQPWPPPTQVDVMCSGVELCPMSWLSCKDYRGGVKWMPPWSPPVPRRMLIRGKGFCPAINSTEMKDVATENFQRIRDAYEILSDENKRQIYDIYGMEGLNSGLERGPKLNQPEEIKEQLERLRRRKEDLRQVLFHVRCNEVVRRWQFIQGIDSILGVDCMNLEEVHWKAYMEDKTIKWIYVLEYISKVVTVALKQLQKQHGGLTLECLSEAAKELLIIANISGPQYLDGNGIRRGKGMSSEVQLPVSKRNTVVVGGNLVVNGTAGTGAATTVLRHQLSSVSSIELMATAGLRSLIGIQSFRQISPHSTATSGLAISLRDGSINLSNAWTRQLSENTVGNIQLVLGTESSLSVGWQKKDEKNSAAGEVKFGTNSFGASAHYTHHFSSKSHGRVAGRVGSTALDIEIGGGRRVSEFSTVRMLYNIGIQGVSWRFELHRAGQKLVIPVLLSTDFNALFVTSAFVIPSTIYFLLQTYVVKPYYLKREKQKTLEKMESLSTQLTEARQAAKKVQKLLEPVSNRKKNRQLENSGLVITKALYGNHKKVKESSELNEINDDVASQVLDVTIPLNFLVTEAGQLKLHEGIKKSGIMGFYDPCPGDPKILLVEYTFRGRKYKVMADDYDALLIPQDFHQI